MLFLHQKADSMSNITALLKGVFRRKQGRKSYVAVYLKRFETIDKLIADDRIGIDPIRALVVLDASIHLLYMDDDRKYNAFFDTIRAYINYKRGLLQVNRLLEPEAPLSFYVVQKIYKLFDIERGEFYDPPHEDVEKLLVGAHWNGKMIYE